MSRELEPCIKNAILNNCFFLTWLLGPLELSRSVQFEATDIQGGSIILKIEEATDNDF